jgi:hypothetical protein
MAFKPFSSVSSNVGAVLKVFEDSQYMDFASPNPLGAVNRGSTIYGFVEIPRETRIFSKFSSAGITSYRYNQCDETGALESECSLLTIIVK